MSGSLRDLQALTRLATLRAEADEVRMATLRAREAAIRAQLADLAAARSARDRSITPEDIALRAGADLLWQSWVESRRKALGLELARLRSEIEKVRLDLARSLGRKIATEDLQARARSDLARARDKREERGW